MQHFDIQELTQQKLEDILDQLDELSIDISSALNHDTLYELCYDDVISSLAAYAEARADDERERNLLEQH